MRHKIVFLILLILGMFSPFSLKVSPSYGDNDTVWKQTLIGHWIFNEGKGTEIVDKAGNFLPGIVKGAEWLSEENAMLFNGQGYIELTSPTNINMVDGIVIEATVFWTGELPEKVNGATIFGGNFGNISYNLCATYFGYSTDKWKLVQYTLPRNRWVNVKAIKFPGNPGKMQIYIDGELITSIEDIKTESANVHKGYKVFIGKMWDDPVWFFRGKIREIKIYSFKEEKRTSDITAIERDKWIASVTPVFIPSTCSGIKILKNIPIILVDNIPISPLISYFGYLYDDWGYKMRPDKTFHDIHLSRLFLAGINIYHTDVIIDLPGGKVDLSRAETQISGIINYQPDVFFLLRIQFRAGKEFALKYPEDVVVFNDGSKSHYTRPQVALLGDATIPRYSLASYNWEREAAEGLVNLARVLSTWKYRDKIIGVIIGAGAYGQWLWWGDFDQSEYCIDFSPAMQKRFVEYLKEKYKDEKTLQKAWRDEKITFATVSIPSKEERGIDIPDSLNEKPHQFDGGFGYFRNPDYGKNQKVIDYFLCISRELGRRIIYLCKTFKQATGNKLLTGVFYSPLSILGFHTEGQSYYREVMDSEWVDFWANPWAYQGRYEGENLFMNAPVSSLHMRNKVYITECDIRTSDTGNRNLGAPLNEWGDLMNIRKNLARLITYNSYGYWFEMRFGWFENEKIFQGFKEASDISTLALSLDRTRNAEIAVIYDIDSIFYASEWLNYITLIRETIQEMGYIGADYDIFTTDDIPKLDTSKYKLFIFPNAFALKDRTREEIKKYLQKDNKVILWIYAPGLINPDRSPALSTKYMEELTGIKLDYVEGRHGSKQRIVKTGIVTKNLPSGFIFGDFVRPLTAPGYTPESPLKAAPVQTYPQFYIDDNKAETFAVFIDTEKAGLAIKKMGKWTSVYCGSIAISSAILRNIATMANVHIYNDTDDIIYTNKSLLGIHTTSKGEKQIKLPQKMDVYDLFENRLVGRNINKFTVSLPEYATVLYFTGNYNTLKKILEGGGNGKERRSGS
ncbi:MAG TPA: hypothetical protein PLE69_06315 [bacterium]|nr:hypothetical protein [bacterium]